MLEEDSTPKDHACKQSRHVRDLLQQLGGQGNGSRAFGEWKGRGPSQNVKLWVTEYWRDLLVAMGDLPDSPKRGSVRSDEEVKHLRAKLVPVHRSWRVAMSLARIVANILALKVPDPNRDISDRVRAIRQAQFTGKEPFKKFERLRQWLYARTPAGKLTAAKREGKKNTPEHRARRALEKRLKYHGVSSPKHLPGLHARRRPTAWQRIEEDSDE